MTYRRCGEKLELPSAWENILPAWGGRIAGDKRRQVALSAPQSLKAGNRVAGRAVELGEFGEPLEKAEAQG